MSIGDGFALPRAGKNKKRVVVINSLIHFNFSGLRCEFSPVNSSVWAQLPYGFEFMSILGLPGASTCGTFSDVQPAILYMRDPAYPYFVGIGFFSFYIHNPLEHRFAFSYLSNPVVEGGSYCLLITC